MIVADTGAIVALVDANDRHHGRLRPLFEDRPEAWILPWAILPEVDHLLSTHVSVRAAERFMADLVEGAWALEWGDPVDLTRAQEIARRYKALRLGLVDSVVMAIAERRKAEAIATLDLRHFAAVTLRNRPHLLPRDLPTPR